MGVNSNMWVNGVPSAVIRREAMLALGWARSGSITSLGSLLKQGTNMYLGHNRCPFAQMLYTTLGDRREVSAYDEVLQSQCPGRDRLREGSDYARDTGVAVNSPQYPCVLPPFASVLLRLIVDGAGASTV